MSDKKVAILATDGFEYVELIEPKKALEAAGAKTVVIAPKDGEIKGWDRTDWGGTVPVDLNLASAKESDFDALVLPGGVIIDAGEIFDHGDSTPRGRSGERDRQLRDFL